MDFESILLGCFVAATSTIFMWIGCAKKGGAPTVQSKAPTPVSHVSMSKSPVSKSPAKDMDPKEDEKKDETKGEDKKEDEKNEEEEKKEEKKEEGEEDKKEEEKKEEDKKGKKKKKKAKSNEKDDEKKEDKKTEEEDGPKKEKTEDEEEKGKKKEPQISVNPAELRFETATTSQKKLRLKNLTDKKLMFKIKASTTNAYLINPVFGKIEPYNFAEVMITHRPSAKRDEKLVIITSEFVGKELELAKTFKHIKAGGPDVTVKLVSY